MSITQPLHKIFLVGPMGAGKSTIGRHMAKALGLTFYDSDAVIEERCGANIPWIFDVEGEPAFRDREQGVIEELTAFDNVLVATGGGAILRPENRRVLSERGLVVYLEVSLEAQVARTERDKKRPLLQNTDDKRATLVTLKAQRDPLYASIADVTFCTDGKAPAAMAQEIVVALSP